VKLDLYFDYVSPFAFFGWRSFRALAEARNLELAVHPIVFGALLDHWGQLGPAEIPPKRTYTFKTVARYAAKHGIKARGPKTHPFNVLSALRASTTEIAGDRQHDVIEALFDAIWVEGIDGGSNEELAAALSKRGFEGAEMIRRTQEPAVKESLKASTANAISRGVFGVPTIFVGDELFWGNDSLEWVVAHLDGRDFFEESEMRDLISRPRGIDRARVRDRPGGSR
jgi:2-hydroxychromene-2-carboxylate isomerase